MDENPNTGWNSGTGSTGTPTDTASSGSFGTTGGGYNATSATDSGICATCGQPTNRAGFEQLLGRLGITDEMINSLKTQFQNVEFDEYFNTARDYLKNGSTKAQSYAKENPGKVAAGVAALALGAGLIYAAVNRDKA
ncbi:MAG TPA: hypothetical protein VKB93_13200 [Thermoanaerobaculia bacterium]|nr:hypothetical protein [Thermoanaerobaculia bacterium]